jgi:hypothetical protein
LEQVRRPALVKFIVELSGIEAKVYIAFSREVISILIYFLFEGSSTLFIFKILSYDELQTFWA